MILPAKPNERFPDITIGFTPSPSILRTTGWPPALSTAKSGFGTSRRVILSAPLWQFPATKQSMQQRAGVERSKNCADYFAGTVIGCVDLETSGSFLNERRARSIATNTSAELKKKAAPGR